MWHIYAIMCVVFFEMCLYRTEINVISGRSIDLPMNASQLFTDKKYWQKNQSICIMNLSSEFYHGVSETSNSKQSLIAGERWFLRAR